MGHYKNVTKPINLTQIDPSNASYKAQFDKFKRIEQLVLNCVLSNTIGKETANSKHIIELQLNNLKNFVNQVIYVEQLNTILHSQIDNILNNKDIIKLYGKQTEDTLFSKCN